MKARTLLWASSVLAACQGAPRPTADGPRADAPLSAPKDESTQGESAKDQSAKDQSAKDEAPTVHVRANGQLGPGPGTLFIDIAPPEGAKLTLESPVTVRGSGGIGLGFPSRLSGPLAAHSLPLRLPIEVADGATGPARLDVTYYWCTDGNEAACRREQASLAVELDLTGATAGGEAHLSYKARDRS